MNLYEMNVAEYMKAAIGLDTVLAAIDRELEFRGAGAFLAEVLGCQCDGEGRFWNDQTETFLTRWQNLAKEGPRNDGYIQNFTTGRVTFYREKYADLMQSFFAERAEDYFEETDNDLFHYAVSSMAYESAYLDFDALALGHAGKERFQEAKRKHDYLEQFELYKQLAELEPRINELVTQLGQAVEDYHSAYNAICNFDGETENMLLLAGHWQAELKATLETVQSVEADLRANGKD